MSHLRGICVAAAAALLTTIGLAPPAFSSEAAPSALLSSTSEPDSSAPLGVTAPQGRSETGATTATSWISGPIAYTGGVNCLIGGVGGNFIPNFVGAYTSYTGAADRTQPVVGQRYYAALTTAIIGNPCAGELAATKLALPPATRLAIDAQNPVRCWFWRDSNPPLEVTADPAVGCRQNPQPDAQGFYDLGFRPMHQGFRFEIWVPVITDAPLTNGADRFTGRVETSVHAPGVSFPAVTAFVAAMPPSALLDAPVRLVDTRTGGGPLAAGTSRCFPVGGRSEIPVTASAAILNVTATGHAGDGHLTVHPAGTAVPATSTLNFDANEYAIANGAIARLGAGGQVCVSAGSSSTHVILDATGYLGGGSSPIQALAQPARLVDTRSSGGAIAAEATRCFPVGGIAGIPSNASAGVLNVTAVGHPGDGHLTVYPAGAAVPGTSTVNFDTSEYAIANSAIVRLGSGGQVCVRAGSSPSHVVIDAAGFVPAGSAGTTLLAQPQRLVDTRAAGGPIPAGSSRCFQVGGSAGIPSGAVAGILNVTAVGHAGDGHVTVYPGGAPVPPTSTLNYDRDQYAIANGAIARLGAGQVCVRAGSAATHVVLDVSGSLG